MNKRTLIRGLSVVAFAGVPLITIASCDPESGYFEFYRDDDFGDSDDCCDDFFDDDHYDDDCFFFVCF